MKSALYKGHIRHRRFAPKAHDFRYRIQLFWLALPEIDTLFSRHFGLSSKRVAPVWFRREDFLGSPSESLDDAVRDEVLEQTGVRPAAPIFLLTQVRQFGLFFHAMFGFA